MADETEKKETDDIQDTSDESSPEDTPVKETSDDTSDKEAVGVLKEKSEADTGETPSEEVGEEVKAEEKPEIELEEEKKKEKAPKAPRKPKKKIEKETLKEKKLPKVDKVAEFNKKYLKSDIPKFKPGDTIRVHYQIVEGDKTRIQVFEGVCIARKHGGLNETIKVRKMSGQIGVERTFFLHSRRITRIEVKKIGKVRRAKIYFLRGKVGKQARIREAGIH